MTRDDTQSERANHRRRAEASPSRPASGTHRNIGALRFDLLLALFPVLLLLACAPAHGPMTDITGAMPPLEFAMMRANDGRAVTAADYRGRVVILYFGYTNCPDACPTTLANLATVLRRLGKQADDVRVLFVTVDPDRDSLAGLRAYATAFAPQIDGLHGSKDAIAELARRYRVSYSVTPASAGRAYEVMHSDSVFFFDRDGSARYVATSVARTDAIGAKVQMLIDQE